MWTLDECKRVFYAVGLIGIVGCCLPSVMVLMRLPSRELFSEFYFLGPEHKAENYPYNVHDGENQTVYLGIENHMGNSIYYSVLVKFRNTSESLPNVTSGVPSILPALYGYRVFLTDGQSWEGTLSFSLSDVVSNGNLSSIGKIRINDAVLDLNKITVWDSEHSGFYYQLFAELWMYNTKNDSFDFHNRFISLSLNVTTSL